MASFCLVLLASAAVPAADPPRPLLLGPVVTPDAPLGFGDVLAVDLCMHRDRVAEVRTWHLELGGVSLHEKPDAVQVVHDGCVLAERPVEVRGDRVRVVYQLLYNRQPREHWLRVFDQRDENGAVPLSWRTDDGTSVAFDRQPDAATSVPLLKRGPWSSLIAGGVVVLLLLWLAYADRKNNILRDSTLDRRRYFRAQLEKFHAERKTETIARVEFISELMTAGIADARTRVISLLEAPVEEQEKLAAALARDMEGKIPDAAGKLEGLYTRHEEVKRRGRRLQEEMAESGIDGAPNPFTQSALFKIKIAEIAGKPPFSLGRCQMAWWTIIIAGSFLLMYLATQTVFEIPVSVLGLLGISVATAGISYGMDARRLPDALPPASSGRLFRDILTDPDGNDTFYRWQIVIWTILLGAVFVIQLLRHFVMTDFDLTMLGLMGISSGTYLGFKFPEGTRDQ